MAKAYGRASSAYRLTLGTAANKQPAVRPTHGVNIRSPSKAVSPAAVAMASNEGTRIATTESPKTAIQPRMKM
jgi:hypothetical protein